MSVANALDTFRNRTRAAAPTARATKSNVTLELTETSIPNTVPPGGRLEGSIGVRVRGGRTDFNDPDDCRAKNLFTGTRVEVEINSGGVELNSQQFCLPDAITGPGKDRKLGFSGTAPGREGTAHITIQVRGANSNNLLLERTFDVTVTEAAGAGFTPENGNGDTQCNGLVDVLTKSECKIEDVVGTGQSFMAGVVGILLLVVVLAVVA